MLADKKPFYRPRLGLWHDKQITQARREGSPLGRGLMEGRPQAGEEGTPSRARPPSSPLQRHPARRVGNPGWRPGGAPTPQVKPSPVGPRARLGKPAAAKPVPVLPRCFPGPSRLRGEGERLPQEAHAPPWLLPTPTHQRARSTQPPGLCTVVLSLRHLPVPFLPPCRSLL